MIAIRIAPSRRSKSCRTWRITDWKRARKKKGRRESSNTSRERERAISFSAEEPIRGEAPGALLPYIPPSNSRMPRRLCYFHRHDDHHAVQGFWINPSQLLRDLPYPSERRGRPQYMQPRGSQLGPNRAWAAQVNTPAGYDHGAQW